MKLIRTLGVGVRLLTCRKGTRIPADDMDVNYLSESKQKSVRVKNISPTGVYILTDDRWRVGETVSFTLKKWTLIDTTVQPVVYLRGKAVRSGHDGVGFAFQYDHIDTASWLNLVGQAEPLIAHRDALHMLRVTKALAFLCRVCPARESENLRFLLDELVYESGDRALDILTNAEELVSRRQLATRADVSPDVIYRILLDGSKNDMAWMRRFWSGLLAAASLQGTNDEKSEEYTELLSKLDTVQIHILTASCTKSGYTRMKSGEIVPNGLAFSADQMRWITGVSDLNHIERCLDRLHQLGLIEQTIKYDPFAPFDVANLTPTLAGLNLYAKCKGQLQSENTSESADQMSLFAAKSDPPSTKKRSRASRKEMVSIL